MKNSLSVVTILVASAVLSFAATNSSSPRAAAGVNATTSNTITQATLAPRQAVVSPGEGSPIPWCPPPGGCSDDVRQIAGEGSPIPWCAPHENCPDDVRQVAGEGSPIPWCAPHENCPDDLRQVAGEGSPIPWCAPHENCPDDLRQVAGEGSPIPWCAPHENCPDDLRLNQTVDIALSAHNDVRQLGVYDVRAINTTTYMEIIG